MSPPTATGAIKVSRERLFHLHVEADSCPQTLLRVLGMLVQQGFEPLTIAAERRADRLRLSVALTGIDRDARQRLVDRIETIVSVGSARFTKPG